MTPRKRCPRASYPNAWMAADFYDWQGNTIHRGDHLRIRGRQGVWTFWDHVINPDAKGGPAEWITVLGPSGVQQFGAVRPELIRRVMNGHRRRRGASQNTESVSVSVSVDDGSDAAA